jgi:hypothetical protein
MTMAFWPTQLASLLGIGAASINTGGGGVGNIYRQSPRTGVSYTAEEVARK